MQKYSLGKSCLPLYWTNRLLLFLHLHRLNFGKGSVGTLSDKESRNLLMWTCCLILFLHSVRSLSFECEHF